MTLQDLFFIHVHPFTVFKTSLSKNLEKLPVCKAVIPVQGYTCLVLYVILCRCLWCKCAYITLNYLNYL